MSDGRQQIRLGIAGFGEVGSTLGRGLRGEGLAQIWSYDKYAFDGPFADLIQRRAREARVELVPSAAALAEHTDVIIGATPGSASTELAEMLRSGLGPRHLYIDIASATPKVKERVGDILSATGALVADGSIMGAPLQDGYRFPLLASGAAAVQFRDLLVPWGMRVEVAGDRLGAASGIKILRSVLMKGLEALLVECALGSARYGVQKEVLESFGQTIDRRSILETANFLVTTGVIHAERRAAEAAMSAEALADVGVEPIMTRSTAARLRWVAEMGLKQHFGGEVPARFDEAIAAIQQKGGGVRPSDTTEEGP